jgi:hypothetical protein
MKQILLFVLIVPLFVVKLNGQGGFGYTLDISKKNNFNVGQGYNQSMETIQHSFFFRLHNSKGTKATQFQFSYREDSIEFSNYSDFLETDGVTLSNYNAEAYLKRTAWKLGVITQHQMGQNLERFVFAFNYGLFYEYTYRVTRNGYSDGLCYNLDNGINRHNLVFTIGTEMRFHWFTVGYKWEKMFFDVLNHDYINNQSLAIGNSSELRGMRIDPGMHFIYLGINFDFY